MIETTISLAQPGFSNRHPKWRIAAASVESLLWEDGRSTVARNAKRLDLLRIAYVRGSRTDAEREARKLCSGMAY